MSQPPQGPQPPPGQPWSGLPWSGQQPYGQQASWQPGGQQPSPATRWTPQPYGAFAPVLPTPAATPPPHVVASTTPHGPSTGVVLGWIGFGLVAAIGFTVVMLLVLSDVGVGGIAVGTPLALLPVVPVLSFYLWLDRYEREPPSALAAVLIWGAAVATFVAIIVNTLTGSVLSVALGTDTATSATAVFVAPFVEEAAKGVAVLAVFLLRRRDFDGIVDGLVYAGFVAVGFAFTENIMYLGRAFTADTGAGLFTFVLRCVFSPFAHPLFTSMTGIGVGLASRSRSAAGQWLWPVGGYLAAVALHMLWNGLSTVTGGSLGAFTLTYLLVQLPLFVGYVVLVVLARRREGRIIAAAAGQFAAAGWISRTDAEMLGSLKARAQARRWAATVGGPHAAQAMKNFQKIGTELAFQRDKMSRGGAAPDAPQREYAGLLGLARLRATFPSPG